MIPGGTLPDIEKTVMTHGAPAHEWVSTHASLPPLPAGWRQSEQRQFRRAAYIVGPPGLAIYGTVKGALNIVSRAAALEWWPRVQLFIDCVDSLKGPNNH